MKMMPNMLLGDIGIPCQVKTRRLATFLAGYSFYFLLLLKGVRKASILIVLCLLSFEWSSARLLEQGMKHFSTFIMTVYSRPIFSVNRSGSIMLPWRHRLKLYKLLKPHCLCYRCFFIGLYSPTFVFCRGDFPQIFFFFFFSGLQLSLFFIFTLDLLWTKLFILFSTWLHLLLDVGLYFIVSLWDCVDGCGQECLFAPWMQQLYRKDSGLREWPAPAVLLAWVCYLTDNRK